MRARVIDFHMFKRITDTTAAALGTVVRHVDE